MTFARFDFRRETDDVAPPEFGLVGNCLRFYDNRAPPGPVTGPVHSFDGSRILVEQIDEFAQFGE